MRFFAMVLGILVATQPAFSQTPSESEVRQLVTFSFLPGKGAEAQDLFRKAAIPLYEANTAMLNFRGFREVESAIPIDLMVVSGFHTMKGMDESNASLRQLAAENGTSIGALYGGIADLSVSHTDEFVEMLPSLGNGDPTSKRLTAFVWYRLAPGQAEAFEDALAGTLAPWERSSSIAATTGRFLLSDGWDYLRMIAFDNLAEYQAYWSEPDAAGHADLARFTSARREVILASDPSLSVR